MLPEHAAPNGSPQAGCDWDAALRGVIPPMISPLDEYGRVDRAAIQRVVDYILAGGCSGLFVLGGVGQGAWLDSAQRHDVVAWTVQAAGGRVPVLAGIMLPGTAPAREAARQAEDAGADGLVIGSPYYFAVTAAEQQRHIESVMSVTQSPVLLYNIPQCTHTPLAFSAVQALAADRRVLGVKDSWGDLPYFQRLLTLKHTRPDFRVLQGSEHAASASMLLGADGLIPGLGNIAPRLMTDLVTAAQRGDAETCRRLHLEVARLADVYTGTGIAGLYRACASMGLASGIPAEPWVRVGDTEAAAIERMLRELNLLPVEAAV